MQNINIEVQNTTYLAQVANCDTTNQVSAGKNAAVSKLIESNKT